MATSLTAEDELNCAICVQRYVEPRKLPGCIHSFCESCILNLILELKKDDKLGSEFECPVCRLPSNSPGKDDVFHRWVSELEFKEELKAKLTKEVKSEQQDIDTCCGHCLSQEKTKYCVTCQEYYCTSCSDTVHAFKVNKNHVLVDLDDTESPGFHEKAVKMFRGFTTCSEHPEEPVMLYCEDEKKFCCLSCSVNINHKNFKHLKEIPGLTEQSSKQESAKILDLVGKLLNHIDSIVAAIKGNTNENKKKNEKIGVDFQEMKQKVINLLDVMEENLKQEGTAGCKTAAMKNQDEIDELYDSKQKLKTVKYMTERLIGNISPVQAFVCVREAELDIENIEEKIIEKGQAIKTSGLELTTTDTFRLIQSLGPNETAQLASVTQPETDILLPPYEDRPFLRKFSVQKTETHNILPKDAVKISSVAVTPTYSGLQFLSENRFILVDSFYGFCCFVNEGFIPSERMHWPQFAVPTDPKIPYSNERHATYLDDDTIAIAVASHQKILLTSGGMHTEKGEIKCEYVPKALCGLRNGDIAIAWDKPVAFGIISSQLWKGKGRVVRNSEKDKNALALSYCERTYFTTDKSGRKLQSFRFMAVNEKRCHVIQPCSVEKAVFCFDLDGNPEFRYSNEYLEDPRGVALDGTGNIYICDTALGSIHVISPDGKAISVIKEGCPLCPLAIGYNKNTNVFAVTEDTVYDAVHFFSVLPK